ncbi:MAG: hypothetical protein ACXVIJ_05695 [Thermoanaerobaculia bacterium]
MRETIRRLLGPLAVYRAVLVALPIAASFVLPPLFDSRTFLAQFQTDAATPGRAMLLETFDSQHYLHLSVYGYQPGATTLAFWPLWPGLIFLGRLFGLTPLLSALVMSYLCSIAGLIVFHRLAAIDLGESGADVALLALLAYPTAFYFALPYSESLFFLLIVLLFYGLRTSSLRMAIIAAALIPLTRPVGAFIVIPLLAHVVSLRERRSLRDFAPIAAACAGVALYFMFMAITTGDAFSAFGAQKWFASHGSLARLLDPAAFFHVLFGPGPMRAFTGSMLDRVFFAFYLAMLVPIWRLNRTYFVYALMLGMIPAVTLYFASFSRYTLVLFPIFIVMGREFSKERAKLWLPVIVAISLAVQTLLYILHCNSHWVA